MEFALKLLFRTVHISSGCVLIGSIFVDAIWQFNRPPNYAIVQAIAGFCLLISGLINMILISPQKSMGSLKDIWVKLVQTKLALWLLLLPLPEIAAKKMEIEFPRRTFNQFLVVFIVLISVYAKQYRDWAVVTHCKKAESSKTS